jgi:hypothetical protein
VPHPLPEILPNSHQAVCRRVAWHILRRSVLSEWSGEALAQSEKPRPSRDVMRDGGPAHCRSMCGAQQDRLWFIMSLAGRL